MGADVDHTGMEEGNPLMLAAFGGEHEHMTLFIEAGANVDLAMPAGGEVALHDAAVNGHTDAVKLLIAAGADVNKAANVDAPTSMFGGRQLLAETPLHFAAEFGDESMINALLDAGADISIESSKGERPIDYAIRAGRSDNILAQELWRYNISVNELIPGPVGTAMADGEDRDGSVFAIDSEWVKSPEDVVPLALFLATQPDVGPTAQSYSLMRRDS